MLDQPQDRIASPGIQSGRRLVKHKDLRFHCHHARNRRAALLASGQIKR